MACAEYRKWCLEEAARRRAFVEKGHLGALADAVRNYHAAEALPQWLAEELIRVISTHAESSGWMKALKRDMVDMVRADTVLGANQTEEARLIWTDAYEYASKYLKGTIAAGKPETIARATSRFNELAKRNPGAITGGPGFPDFSKRGDSAAEGWVPRSRLRSSQTRAAARPVQREGRGGDHPSNRPTRSRVTRSAPQSH